MSRCPTEKQRNFLNTLGYKGQPPISLSEASDLIDEIKNGTKPERAEKQMLSARAKWEKKQLAEIREYLKSLDDMNREYHTCSGFRIQVENEEAATETRQYHRAFLSLDVAKKHPELLLLQGLYYDDELQRVPTSGKFIVSPGDVRAVAGKQKRRGRNEASGEVGCFRRLRRLVGLVVLGAILVIAAIIFLSGK